MNIAYRQTEIGKVGIGETAGCVTHLFFACDAVPRDAVQRETPLLKEAFRQLGAYLCGDLKAFALPLAPAGTPFQRKVWRILERIPYGKTVSYKDVAVQAGNPLATRAVGMANHRNPIPVFIPCHRVIGANGTLVGYGGGLAMKTRLLAIEGVFGINE
ncbi:MAG TPA: methylated-DNA--[protein]-cysteine S-methyltransferase [Kiritimatiellia bacterium]|nr:methylated-DNA--[protein]-cysteine S-methyltransferase [Kiritimatiellia bacterium]HPS06466.1 methylated-DNA--[protein]-cysteine S-methyltransferase [Kiritimatiellia bacterium]